MSHFKPRLVELTQQLDQLIREMSAASDTEATGHEVRSVCRGTGFLRAALRSIDSRELEHQFDSLHDANSRAERS